MHGRLAIFRLRPDKVGRVSSFNVHNYGTSITKLSLECIGDDSGEEAQAKIADAFRDNRTLECLVLGSYFTTMGISKA
jgi:hypothetical protein